MTDNTPRPEPMTRDAVCSFLRAAVAFGGVPYDELCKVTNAVAALYVKNAQLEAQLQERISELFAMELEREALKRAVERKDGALRLYCNLGPCPASDHEIRQALGTEPSDAEGGG